jgi:hypothetical protein
LKKKSKNPSGLLASNLVGEKLARRMQYDDAQELIKSVTLRNGAFRKVAKKRS